MQAWGMEASVRETGGPPAVVARVGSDPGKKTVLIYGHYDVQPPEPLEEWTTPPFEPRIADGKVYARGSADNKGQVLAHLLGTALELEERGELPVNVIYVVEGEEEVGSPRLEEFLTAHREEFACDVVAISDTGMVASGYPTLTYGLRGIAALELVVRGPSHDLHSGNFGGAVMNPATAVARLLASLHDADGRVAVEGFYDAIPPMEAWEREALAALPAGDAEIREMTGAPALFGEAGYSGMERIGARPTAEVNGMGGGYQGEGTKTVLPKSAFAKLTFRLVPHQDPQVILNLVETHLKKHLAPGVTLELTRGHSAAATVCDPKSGFGRAATRALELTFGKPPALVREGGSIPIVESFARILGAETLLLGLANPDCRAHSPNENFDLANLESGIRLHRALLQELARA